MFKVILLVCAMGTARADCQMNNALQVMYGPDVPNSMMCLRESQFYLARVAATRFGAEDDYVKIQCVRSGIGDDQFG